MIKLFIVKAADLMEMDILKKGAEIRIRFLDPAPFQSDYNESINKIYSVFFF